MFVRKSDFKVVAGELKVHAYEARERSFCGECGSPITFSDLTLTGLVEVSIGSLDQAAEIVPADYNWMEDRLPWVVVDPALPQFTHNSGIPCLS